MFHVASMLPYQEMDEQRVERKRHLGNDVILLIFKEGKTPFNPLWIKSHFNRKNNSEMLYLVFLRFFYRCSSSRKDKRQDILQNVGCHKRRS